MPKSLLELSATVEGGAGLERGGTGALRHAMSARGLADLPLRHPPVREAHRQAALDTPAGDAVALLGALGPETVARAGLSGGAGCPCSLGWAGDSRRSATRGSSRGPLSG